MTSLNPQNQTLSFYAALFTILLCVLFGANAVAIKICIRGIGAFTTAGIRFSIAAAAITIWALLTHRSFRLKKGQFLQILIISLIFTIQLSLFYFGISKTYASRASLIINLLPFFVLCLAHFFIPGDVITGRKFIGILMGFGGVLFLFASQDNISSQLLKGDFIILGVALLWACNTVYIKRIVSNFKPFQIVLYPMLFSVPFFFLQGFLWDGQMVDYVNVQIIASLLYQSLVTASFGFIAWNTLLQKYEATSLNAFMFVMPISGVVLSGILLDDRIDARVWFALIFIAAGILVIHLNPKLYNKVLKGA
ncbi:DMT family transporter [Desulfococcaceae bacterium HSG7]|nr:DMT family transporter [Desulfococcaceae bacterium HSG7]